MTDLEVLIVNQLAARGWGLAGPHVIGSDWSKFLADVQRALGHPARSSLSDAQRLERAITFAYCPILYAACNDQGSDLQHGAFEELWEWVYRRVYPRVNQANDTEDITQKVMLKVYQSLHQVREPRGFLGYVSVIMQHEIGDHYRRKSKESLHDVFPLGGDDEINGDKHINDLADPLAVLHAELLVADQDLIRSIYECLPRQQRRRADVLVALALKGETVVEVAEAMKTTPSNVHLMYFRAKRDLLEHCRHVIELAFQSLAPSQRAKLKERE